MRVTAQFKLFFATIRESAEYHVFWYLLKLCFNKAKRSSRILLALWYSSYFLYSWKIFFFFLFVGKDNKVWYCNRTSVLSFIFQLVLKKSGVVWNRCWHSCIQIFLIFFCNWTTFQFEKCRYGFTEDCCSFLVYSNICWYFS